ncbi:hypothetical protein [Pseudolabrys sp. FHR47]|uniref:hypothetical protein n=1 Tax=Pseudolabrys sp. FHR47 TaxID=2562284 RepID=UPI0010BEFE05|nr:hypothetical protein [Pseudolabrys sp. FHR47]
MRTVLTILRMLCYVAFAVVGAATLVIAVTETFNLCPGFSANTGLSCGGAWYEGLANAAMGLVMLSLLSLVPAVLAIAGLIFAIVDLVRWRRRRAAAG